MDFIHKRRVKLLQSFIDYHQNRIEFRRQQQDEEKRYRMQRVRDDSVHYNEFIDCTNRYTLDALKNYNRIDEEDDWSRSNLPNANGNQRERIAINRFLFENYYIPSDKKDVPHLDLGEWTRKKSVLSMKMNGFKSLCVIF